MRADLDRLLFATPRLTSDETLAEALAGAASTAPAGAFMVVVAEPGDIDRIQVAFNPAATIAALAVLRSRHPRSESCTALIEALCDVLAPQGAPPGSSFRPSALGLMVRAMAERNAPALRSIRDEASGYQGREPEAAGIRRLAAALLREHAHEFRSSAR